MKKVWILEKFATHEEMVKQFEEYKAMVEMEKSKGANAEDIALLEKFIANYEKMIENNPNGRRHGFEGKSIYRQFCDYAKAAIRRNPDGKFRVIEGEIDDNATKWIGYRMVKENEGVLRYLMATK